MAAHDAIRCTSCGAEISISEALSAELGEHLRAEYAQRLGEERARIEKKIKAEMQAALSHETEELRASLKEKSAALVKAQAEELALRKKAREMEEREQALELEIQRRLDDERKQLEAAIVVRVHEAEKMKLVEKDHQLEAMRRQIEELRRRADQGSQQTQGEVMEIQIESLLRNAFPRDAIEPVPKGVRGADIIQRVMSPSGGVAGVMLWETKRTKHWSDGWIVKLKEDQRAMGAEIAVIVSDVLPKGVRHVGHFDGIWVVDDAAMLGLAIALRSGVLQVYQARQAATGQGQKQELLYEYILGASFRQKIETLVETFIVLRDDLDREKRAVQKLWSMREQQLEKLMSATSRLYGEVQGIIGPSLAPVRELELQAPELTEQLLPS